MFLNPTAPTFTTRPTMVELLKPPMTTSGGTLEFDLKDDKDEIVWSSNGWKRTNNVYEPPSLMSSSSTISTQSSSNHDNSKTLSTCALSSATSSSSPATSTIDFFPTGAPFAPLGALATFPEYTMGEPLVRSSSDISDVSTASTRSFLNPTDDRARLASVKSLWTSSESANTLKPSASAEVLNGGIDQARTQTQTQGASAAGNQINLAWKSKDRSQSIEYNRAQVYQTHPVSQAFSPNAGLPIHGFGNTAGLRYDNGGYSSQISSSVPIPSTPLRNQGQGEVFSLPTRTYASGNTSYGCRSSPGRPWAQAQDQSGGQSFNQSDRRIRSQNQDPSTVYIYPSLRIDSEGGGNKIWRADRKSWYCGDCGLHNSHEDRDCVKCLEAFKANSNARTSVGPSPHQAQRNRSDYSVHSNSFTLGSPRSSADSTADGIYRGDSHPYFGVCNSGSDNALSQENDRSAQQWGMRRRPGPIKYARVDPEDVMARIKDHVKAVMSIAYQGQDMVGLLVEGDPIVCYRSGMKGLIGIEAINPWKILGFPIPEVKIDKNGLKPALGDRKGDWNCSCGRENWAQRSVCSKCFPDVEPSFKFRVFDFILPIVQVMEQDARGAQLRQSRDALVARNDFDKNQSDQDSDYFGPRIGRQFVSEKPRRNNNGKTNHGTRYSDHFLTVSQLRVLPPTSSGAQYSRNLQSENVSFRSSSLFSSNLDRQEVTTPSTTSEDHHFGVHSDITADLSESVHYGSSNLLTGLGLDFSVPQKYTALSRQISAPSMSGLSLGTHDDNNLRRLNSKLPDEGGTGSKNSGAWQGQNSPGVAGGVGSAPKVPWLVEPIGSGRPTVKADGRFVLPESCFKSASMAAVSKTTSNDVTKLTQGIEGLLKDGVF